MNEFSKYIAEEETDINEELFKKNFNTQTPSQLFKYLFDLNNKTKKIEIEIIKSGLFDLKNEIKNMSEDEINTEKPHKILDIVEEILTFDKLNQEGHDLKIITPSQMLSRLPISLAQINAGNNSKNLKNEIRQLLYSLYCSKNITKEVYNNLIKYI